MTTTEHKGPRILHVEDDSAIFDPVQDFCKLCIPGSSVTVVTDLAAAQAAVQAGGYDVIITDGQFPLANGTEKINQAGQQFIKWLKQTGSTVPIVVLSSEESLHKYAQQHGIPHLEKNGNFLALIDAIERALQPSANVSPTHLKVTTAPLPAKQQMN